MQTPYFLLFILIFYNWFAIIYIDIDSGAKVEWEKMEKCLLNSYRKRKAFKIPRAPFAKINVRPPLHERPCSVKNLWSICRMPLRRSCQSKSEFKWQLSAATLGGGKQVPRPPAITLCAM